MTQDSRSTSPTTTQGWERSRSRYVDVFRGLLIAHMALDHASLLFNEGRMGEELASTPPMVLDAAQFITRFSGVPVAPGFFFMAGFAVALSTNAKMKRGASHREVTRHLILRGLVLIAADALVMGLPRMLTGFYSFSVLSCVGSALIILALLRTVASKILLPAALVALILHPLIDVSHMPVAVQAVLYEPIRSGVFRSLYPVIPWAAIAVLGLVAGRDALTRVDRDRFWTVLGLATLAVFTLVRVTGGYGNAYEYSSVASMEFWLFAKYPPDLAFLTWALGWDLILLAIVSRVTRDAVPQVLRPFETIGRVSFFFYIVHFYVLGVGFALMQRKFGLLETYGTWLLLLIVMIFPCRWYDRLKRDRPNLLTRYI